MPPAAAHPNRCAAGYSRRLPPRSRLGALPVIHAACRRAAGLIMPPAEPAADYPPARRFAASQNHICLPDVL